MLIRARYRGHRVPSGAPSGSLGSFASDLVVVGFVRGAPGGIIRFSRARPEGRRVHSDESGRGGVHSATFGRALRVSGLFGFVGFIRALGVVRFIYNRWVHSGAPGGSSG